VPRARRTLEGARILDPAALPSARASAGALRRALDHAVLSRFDALLTATALVPAPPLADYAGEADVWPPVRTIAFNVTGHPALSVPAGQACGLPVGLQIAGADTGLVCQIGDAFERAAR
jgi:aspartyl-tRNA(Asn)/glutamyl-tRNA(Gln) amidotransferase subunit A